MDTVIEEMAQRIMNWRHRAGHGIHQGDLERWAQHLRDIVQPQLDELEALKAAEAESGSKRGKRQAVQA